MALRQPGCEGYIEDNLTSGLALRHSIGVQFRSVPVRHNLPFQLRRGRYSRGFPHGKKTMSKYQGYPYVNPYVNDVPTVDPATAARWANLPRKPLQLAIPGASGSGQGTSRENISSSSGCRTPGPSSKKEEDDNPVVYIDLPEADASSSVCESNEAQTREPEFVNDTVLYDPFDNKRIVVGRDDTISKSSSETSFIEQESPTSSRPYGSNDRGFGPQSPGSSSRPGPPSLPSFMQKEAFIYGGHSSDGFPISPIPVSEFPEPPPAYTEVATTPSKPVQEQPKPVEEPPRTQVIVPVPEPSSPIGPLSYGRKYVTCQHCNVNVHTLVIRENGCITYTIALILFCILVPLFLVVYFCDSCKHKNHYCPNCNKLIGFELPLIGQRIHFVDKI